MNGFFHKLAQGTAALIGSHWAFVVAFAGCLLWALMGPVFDYSSTWQLVINTATTVLTFLAVFLIQNTQNRNDLAVQLKLDELLRAIETARSGLIDLEDATDEEIETLRRAVSAPARSAKRRSQVVMLKAVRAAGKRTARRRGRTPAGAAIVRA